MICVWYQILPQGGFFCCQQSRISPTSHLSLPLTSQFLGSVFYNSAIVLCLCLRKTHGPLGVPSLWKQVVSDCMRTWLSVEELRKVLANDDLIWLLVLLLDCSCCSDRPLCPPSSVASCWHPCWNNFFLTLKLLREIWWALIGHSQFDIPGSQYLESIEWVKVFYFM